MTEFSDLFGAIVTHFKQRMCDGSPLALFVDHARQVEGWFKGEMMSALENAPCNWQAEVTYGEASKHGRKKCDFVLAYKGEKVGVEAKAGFVGKQRKRYILNDEGESEQANPWRMNYCIEGLLSDAEKLSVNGEGLHTKLCLLFVYGEKEALHEEKQSVDRGDFKGKLDPANCKRIHATEIQGPHGSALAIMLFEVGA